MPDTLRLAGALVAPHSHDDLLISVHESGTQVVAAVSVLDFGLGFDVTEEPPGEANIALDLTEAVWTFGQGGFCFRDGSGPVLSSAEWGDDLFLTGDFDVSGVAAIGNNASIDSQGRVALRVQHSVSVSGGATGLDARVYYTGVYSYQYMYGVQGEARWQGTGVSAYLSGLSFNVVDEGAGGSVASMTGARVGLYTVSGAAALTDARGIQVYPSFAGPRPTTYYGIHLQAGQAGSLNTGYGLRVEDLAGTTIRLLEIGPSTPYLRLVGGAAPGANQTNLYLYEGGTPALRRVQWKDYSNLMAGDRVMVLV